MASGAPPNVLFVFPEDWGRFASAYAHHDSGVGLNSFVRTPHFDRIAAEGALFLNARTPAPGCNPCRSSLFSGRYFWQTGLGAIEQGTEWDPAIPTWPLELERGGHFLGYTYEGDYGKTNARVGGERTAFNSAGKTFGDFSRWVTRESSNVGGLQAAKQALLGEVRSNFCSFLDCPRRAPGQRFCYIWGPTTTHRGAGWQPGSGRQLWGIDPASLQGRLPAFFPDVPEVRDDVANYLGQVCAMDAGLGVLLAELEARGELDRTLVVVTGDHGMPGVPRGKASLYDFGSRVALAVRWPGRVARGRIVEDLVNTMDLAPTLCEAGGVGIPQGMTAQSLMALLMSPSSGQVESSRDFVVNGLERHVSIARDDFTGYPMRAIRTRGFLYIENFAPDRWPAGDIHGLDDLSLDVGDVKDIASETMVVLPDFDASPTKAWLIQHRGDPAVAPLFRLAFCRRPREELYDLERDEVCMHNVAADVQFAPQKAALRGKLMEVLTTQGDPRLVEQPCRYEAAPYAMIFKKYVGEKGEQFMQGLRKRRASWQPPKHKL